MNKVLSPYIQVLLAATIWGSGGIFIKIIALPSPSIAFFRLFIPTLLIGGWLWYKHETLYQRDTHKLLLMSGLNALRMYLFFIGYLYTTVGNATIAQKMSPIFVLILAALILGESITKKKITSIIIACVGIIFLYVHTNISFTHQDVIGISAILGAAAISAYINIIFKEVIQRHSKESMIFYQCVVGAGVFFFFLVFTSPYPTIEQITLSSVYAIVIGIIGFLLYFNALRHMGAGKANILTYIEPVSALILAFLFLGEIPQRNTLIGAVCIMSAIYILRKEV